MKRNFNFPITDLDGKPILTPDGVPFTAKKAVCDALLTIDQKEQVSGEEKAKRYSLATRIYKAEADVDLKVEELATLKSVVGNAFGPIVVGPLFAFLDGDANG